MQTMNTDGETANYSVYYLDKEFIFEIDRAGKGKCHCRSDAWKNLQREDVNIVVRALFQDQKAQNRIADLEGEFSFDVELDNQLTKEIWAGWDRVDLKRPETQVATSESKASE